MGKKIGIFIGLILITGVYLFAVQSPALAQEPAPDPDNMILLGKALFFDERLSANGTQSCAACHGAAVGFTGPDAQINAGGAVYPGAIPHRFGNRKPPASAYAGASPELYQDSEGGWFGGMFWDGRATGWTLHDPLAEQAQGPFLNPLEQAIANSRVLCVRVRQSEYAGLFEEVWGSGSLNCAKNVAGVYEMIGRSVAAYERSPEVNPYSSKFDQFWDSAAAAGKNVQLIKCGMGGPGMGGPGMGAAAVWGAAAWATPWQEPWGAPAVG